MIPSFALAVFSSYIIPHIPELTSIAHLIHEIMGCLAITLGVWFVASGDSAKTSKAASTKES